MSITSYLRDRFHGQLNATEIDDLADRVKKWVDQSGKKVDDFFAAMNSSKVDINIVTHNDTVDIFRYLFDNNNDTWGAGTIAGIVIGGVFILCAALPFLVCSLRAMWGLLCWRSDVSPSPEFEEIQREINRARGTGPPTLESLGYGSTSQRR